MKKLLFFTFCAITCLAILSACRKRENTSDSIEYYSEPNRPQLHFSPEKMWMNDPNGMVYYQGEYHLFYQYYPDGDVWGPMHWGHAISKNMIHWQHLPIALYPDTLGYIFSGSAVVDWHNSSGFGTGENPPLIAIFTYHDPEGEKANKDDFQTQGIAFSINKGRTWEKYSHNPILSNPGIKNFRDPKVFWHKESNKWIMILAAGDRIKLYSSQDLKDWIYLSDFGENQGSHEGVWECPDLFPLSIGNSKREKKWVIIVSIGNEESNDGSKTQYFVGNFDGKIFTNENEPSDIFWIDHGKDNYAGVTWSDIPKKDGRRIFMGWMSNWKYAERVPTNPWRNAMTIPRTLTLRNSPSGIRLYSKPVKEIKYLYTQIHNLKSEKISDTINLSQRLGLESTQLLLTLELELTGNSLSEVGIEISNKLNEKILIAYQVTKNRFFIDRTLSGKKTFDKHFIGKHFAPRNIAEEILKMQILIDAASVELFADEGEVVMTELFFPNKKYNTLKVYTVGDEVINKLCEVVLLKSIWKKDKS